ncbi:putative Translation Initiation Inhibitor [Ectocarpus siliculosus]|uniref:Translation Initiation Inhibitor n=1 Tax=Ectocarpus siliculosus TaxID=2880 RepID=D8LF39_ECTSI|nr:putative Translation Initiation Inhibitor [Ectocarpus siliculosus]|eukprot:CBN78637.1 putative Translation Initiation Inhibitor [Ectocarpus siliculosus]
MLTHAYNNTSRSLLFSSPFFFRQRAPSFSPIITFLCGQPQRLPLELNDDDGDWRCRGKAQAAGHHAARGNYVLHRRSGDTLYMSGHLPKAPDGTLTTGKVGSDLEIEQGAEAARLVAINLITTMKAAAGDLDKIRLVKITGFVRSADGFTGQSAVLNGASDLLLEVFGREKGAHARSAVGVNALPLGVCVEIEAIAEVVS